jgi:perosamine synthetase
MSFKVPYSGISNRLGLEEAEMVLQALRQDTLALGPMNAEFEKQFSEYLGATHVQATSSCTTALYLAAQVLGLKEGDEVITTPQTFWVTSWPLQVRRCVIRFADIDPNSLNIDPAQVESLVTERTRSIWVVHHGGQAVDMDPIMEIAHRHDLTVLEDCAHAPGATYKGRRVGTIGDIACFSFHSLKNMTAGEGGALVTNNDLYAEMARHLGTIHVWGRMEERDDQKIGPYTKPAYYEDWHARFAFTKDYVDGEYEVGNNFRLSELSAALGIAQLQKLDQLNERRRTIASRLNEGLQGVAGITLQEEKDYAYHIYHLYTCFYHPEVVGAPKDDFIRYMEQEEGVQIVVRYFPIHLLSEFRALGHQYGECPVAERTYFEHQIQLPIYGHLTEGQIDHMIGAVRRAVERLKGGGYHASSI